MGLGLVLNFYDYNMGMLLYTIEPLDITTVVKALSQQGFSLQKLEPRCDPRDIRYQVSDGSSLMHLVFYTHDYPIPSIFSLQSSSRGFHWNEFKLKRRLIAALRSLGAVNTTHADLDLIEPPVKKPVLPAS